MMCDKCGAKSADIELYCKNCGSDLQIFGAGAEKVKLTSETKEEAPETSASPAAESPLGPPPSGAFPPPPPGSPPGQPSPGTFGNIPGFPISAPPLSGQTPPAPPPATHDAQTNPEDVPSFISRSVPPSTAKPFTAPEEKSTGEPVDFSFLGKPSGQSPEPEKVAEENSPPPASPAPSPGTFSPDFFKPKE